MAVLTPGVPPKGQEAKTHKVKLYLKSEGARTPSLTRMSESPLSFLKVQEADEGQV